MEKELSQLHQAQSALDTALTLFDSGDYAKSLEYVDKVVLVFSPACLKVTSIHFSIRDIVYYISCVDYGISAACQIFNFARELRACLCMFNTLALQ